MITTKNDFLDRRSAAATAKAALVQAYRAAAEAGESTRIARQEERLVLAAARTERQLAREAARLAEQERLRVEAAEAAARTVAGARRKKAERPVSVVEDEAARKAKRDQRYAARRARQR